MKRRRLLASVGVGSTVGLTGCLERYANLESYEDAMTSTKTEIEFESRTIRDHEPVIEGGIGEDDGREYYATLLVDETDVARVRTASLDAETNAFVEETDVAERPLLVVQYHLPSVSLELAIESIQAAQRHLDVAVHTTGEYLLEESITESVVARLSLEDRPTPKTATVELVDRDRTVQFDAVVGEED